VSRSRVRRVLASRTEAAFRSSGSSVPHERKQRSAKRAQNGGCIRDEEGVVAEDESSKRLEFSSPQEGSSEIAAVPNDDEALANLKRILGVSPSHEGSPVTGRPSASASDLLTAVNTDAPSKIGNPLTDDEIRKLGFEPTRRGWVPRKAASDAA